MSEVLITDKQIAVLEDLFNFENKIESDEDLIALTKDFDEDE